ncbi:IclR family transcriptional regulator [Pelagibius marinus]|uniref:IclR family transcriptional regulator n=1 Tax=Pelagibius marinus TaxID=2762760 RepID=UPI00187238F6|nr:IclR family transcriptional regulator [Pelagibius marinus]
MAKSAVRTLEILEAVAKSGVGMSHGEISKALGIPKSSMTALLKDLTQSRYLEFDESTGLFRLGPQILVLSNAYLRNFDPIRRVVPEVAQLARSLGETAHIAILDGDDILVVHHELGRHVLSAVMRIGDRAPAILTAAGRAMLAFFDPREQRRHLKTAKKLGYTLDPDTVTDLADIAAGAVSEVRDTLFDGLSACAIPLFGPASALPFGSISVALPSSRLNAKSRKLIHNALKPLQDQYAPEYSDHEESERSRMRT